MSYVNRPLGGAPSPESFLGTEMSGFPNVYIGSVRPNLPVTHPTRSDHY